MEFKEQKIKELASYEDLIFDEPEIDLIQLNVFLGRIAKESKNKKAFYNLSKEFYENTIPINYLDFSIREMTLDGNIGLVLSFFKSIGTKYYTKAKQILENKSAIKINFAQLDEENLEKYKNLDVFADSFDPAAKCIIHDGISKINIIPRGDIRDSISIVHEIAHTFDSSKNYLNNTKDLLCEITSNTMQNLYEQFLLDRKIIDVSDFRKIKKEEIVCTKQKALQNLIQIDLIDQKEKYFSISELELEDVRQKYGLSYRLSRALLADSINCGEDFIFNSRYLIAQLVTANMFEKFNKSKILESYEKFTYQVEKNNKAKALEYLGIDIKKDNLDDLVKNYNSYLNNLLFEYEIER